MPTTRPRELREFQISELREEAGNGVISGYASVFDQKAEVWDYVEVVRKGAFAKTLSEDPDVYAFWNHDSSKVLGRTRNQTLTLTEDDHGLRVEIKLPDTPTAQEARELIRLGYVDKMSFGFAVVKDRWTRNQGEPALREVLEVQLFEVSPVPMPAYEGTAAQARQYNPNTEATPEAPLAADTHQEPSALAGVEPPPSAVVLRSLLERKITCSRKAV